MKAIRGQVYAALESEDRYAMKKWSDACNCDYPSTHEVASWIAYMEHHLALARAIASSSFPETGALDEIRKVTNLGVRAMMDKGAPRREGY